MDVFCSLCGGRVEPPRDGAPAGGTGLRWDGEARAVRTRAYVHGAHVTGLGFLRPGRGAEAAIVAPAGEGASYRTVPARLLEAHEVRPRLSLFWCFPVHGVCWDLVRVAADPARVWPAAAVAAHLFALLYNLPSDAPGHPTPDHGYGGALRFHGSGSWRQVVGRSDLAYLLADPNDTVGWTPDPAPLAAPAPAIASRSGAGREPRDVFRKFPGEVLMLVLENLPSPDCGRLRLASRYAASVSSVPQLPPSFWRSRFAWPHEMAFAFAGREDQGPPEPADWRQMYMTARGVLQNPAACPGFRHRYHIWKILQHLAPALALRLRNARFLARVPYGGGDPGLPMEATHCFGTASAQLVLEHGRAPGQPADHAAMRPLYAGCRLYEEQCLCWEDGGASETISLAVSSVSVNGKVYISGLRYVAPHQHVGPREYARVGFIDPSSEQRVVLNKADILEAVVLNVQADGILGLRFDVRDPERLTTHAFGQLDLSQAAAGSAQISYHGQLQQACFLVGLDACKIVALSLYAPKGPGTAAASGGIASTVPR